MERLKNLGKKISRKILEKNWRQKKTSSENFAWAKKFIEKKISLNNKLEKKSREKISWKKIKKKIQEKYVRKKLKTKKNLRKKIH